MDDRGNCFDDPIDISFTEQSPMRLQELHAGDENIVE